MAVDGFLNFDTKINTSGFKNGIKNISSGLDGVKNQLKEIATIIVTAFSVKEIINLGKSAIEVSAEISASNSQMEQAFGSMLNTANKAIERVAKSSGIVQTRLNGVGTSIYAFAKTSGMDSVQALSLMEDALKVTADASAYYDKSLEETSETLKSFLKGNYANDSALGISCTETTRNTVANRLYGKSFKELSEAQKQLALLQMVKDANALSGAEGQAAREADGWENVIGNLKETWKQLLAVIGQPMLKVATIAVKQLTSALSYLTKQAQYAINSLSKIFGWESESSEITSKIPSNISQTVENQDKLTQAVEETNEVQKNSLAGFDKINTVSSNTAENKANSPEISEQVSIEPTADESAVEETAEETADGLAERIKRLFEPVKLAWDANFPQLAETANQAKESLKSIFADISESIESVWTNGTGEKYVSNIIRLFTQIIGIIGDVSNALDNAWNDGGRGTALVQSYFDAWNSFLILLHETGATFRLVWNDGTGEEICGNILEILTNINDIAKNLQTDFWIAWNTNHNGERILSGILGIFNGILSFINRITKSTAEWAKRLDFSPLLGSVADLLESLKPLTDTVFDALAWAYEKVLLPLGKWTIEKAVPVIIGLFSSAIKVLTSAINLLKPVAEWLIEKFLTPIASWTGGGILSVLSYLSEKLDTLADLLSGKISFKEFIDGLNGIEVAVGAVVTAVGLVLGGQAIAGLISVAPVLLSAIVSQTSALIPLVAEWVALNLPIIAVTGAVAGVIAIGVLLIKHWDEVKEFAEKTWESIKKTVSSAWNGIKSAWSGAKDWFAKVWTSIQLTFSIAGKWFKATFALAWENVKSAWSNAVKWFSDLWSDIKSIFSIVGNWFSDRFREAWNGITSIFCGIGSWFGDRWNDIANIFWQVGNWFSQRFWEAWENITNIFSGHNVWTFFNQVWTIITNVFSHVSNWFRDTFSSAWEAVKNVFSSGGAVFMGIVDGIFNTFKTVVNALIDGINWVVAQPFNALNGALDGMRGIEIAGIQPFYWLPYINIPQIPYLAQGTVVPANYGEFLAVLGDNKRETEVVSPLSTIEQAVVNAMKKSNSEIHVHVELDGREIGRVAVKAVNENNRRKGG